MSRQRGGVLALTLVLAMGCAVAATRSGLPKIDGVEALASVNGEPLPLDEYLAALAEMHAGVEEHGQVVAQRDPLALLQRLINVKLVLQEARAIGIDELPEFEKPVAQFRQDTLREALFERATRDLPPPAAAEIERAYRDRVEELEVELVSFADRESADAFVAELAGGGAFAAAARQSVAAGRAESYDEPKYVARIRLLPTVGTVLDGLAPGQISPPLAIAQGFGVIHILASRVPEDPAKRQQVELEVAGAKRAEALRAYVGQLRDKHLETDEELWKSLDFDAAAAAFDAFLADERIVARVDGAEPVRVKDVARGIESRMFHGVEQAAQKRRLAKTKDNVLEQLTTERLLAAEARRRKLDQTPRFAAEVTEFENALLFGLFMAKAIEPGVEVTAEEIAAFYAAHLVDFTEPEMIRLESLCFRTAGAAQRALERLNAGADLDWMRANAEGQVELPAVPEALRFANQLLTVSNLPADLARSLAGAGSGDFRIYAETAERNHVIFVRDRLPARPRPLEQVRDEVRQKAFALEREQALGEWTAKMRAASAIEVFVDAAKLRALIEPGATR